MESTQPGLEALANLKDKKLQAIQAAFAVEEAHKLMEQDALHRHPTIKELNRRATFSAAARAINHALAGYKHEEERRADADHDEARYGELVAATDKVYKALHKYDVDDPSFQEAEAMSDDLFAKGFNEDEADRMMWDHSKIMGAKIEKVRDEISKVVAYMDHMKQQGASMKDIDNLKMGDMDHDMPREIRGEADKNGVLVAKAIRLLGFWP